VDKIQIGDIAETQILARLTKLGYIVLKPWTHSCRYDFVMDDGLSLSKVQCKTGHLRCGSIVFRSSSANIANGGIRYRRSYLGEIDYFATYCVELDKCYLIPISKIQANTAILRVTEIPATHRKYIASYLWAKDYEI
jgi:hypothetical protein